MRQFLKFVLATIVGLLAFSLLSILVLAAIAGAASSSSKSKGVAANSVLELQLNEPLTERGQATDFNPLGGRQASTGLVALKEAIRRAKTHDDQALRAEPEGRPPHETRHQFHVSSGSGRAIAMPSRSCAAGK